MGGNNREDSRSSRGYTIDSLSPFWLIEANPYIGLQ